MSKTHQQIIDKHLKDFHETHHKKVPIELNSYLLSIIQEAVRNEFELMPKQQ